MTHTRASFRAATVALLAAAATVAASHTGAQASLRPRPYGLGTTVADSLRYYSNFLTSEDPETVANAFGVLESMGRRAESLAGGIALMATHLEPAVRARAAHTLTAVSPPEIAVPALRDLCADTTQTVRIAAYEAIGYFGPSARATLPRLRQHAATAAAEEQAAAESAIEAVRAGAPAKGAKTSTEADADALWIAEELRAVSPIMRRLAADGLAEMGAEGKSAAPALIKSLNDGDAAVRLKAARALLAIAGNSRRSREALLARVADSTEVLETRIEILRRTAGSDSALVKPIEKRVVAQLASHDDPIRQGAASLLGDFPYPGPDLITGLAKALEDPASEVRLEAANSLGTVGPPARDALPALKSALRGGDSRLRQIAEISIARIEQ